MTGSASHVAPRCWASASTGIPTAGDMTWDFKRRYSAPSRGSLHPCAQILVTHWSGVAFSGIFDNIVECPSEGSSEEYAFYLSATDHPKLTVAGIWNLCS